MTWREAVERVPEDALEMAVALAPTLDEALGEALVDWVQRRCLELRDAPLVREANEVPTNRYSQRLQDLERLFGQGFHLVSREEQRRAARAGDSYTDEADGEGAQAPDEDGPEGRVDTPQPPEEERALSTTNAGPQGQLQFSVDEVTGALEQFTAAVADFANALNGRQPSLARLQLRIAELSSKKLILMLESLLRTVEGWEASDSPT